MAENLTLVDTGVIFRNPLPGHRVINSIYPYITVLDNGDWFCLLRVGVALYSPDGVIEAFRSRDEGKTWVREGPIHPKSKLSYFDATVTKMRDGSLLARLSRVDLRDDSSLVFNAKTGGLLPMPIVLLRSKDNGKTWSKPQPIDWGNSWKKKENPAPYSRVFELSDGSLLQTFETWKHYNDKSKYNLQIYGLFSHDGGKSWGERTTIASGSSYDRSFSHCQPTQLRDGRLYGTAWCAEPQLQRYFDLFAVVSTDATGRTWEKPRPTGIPGQSSCAEQLDDKRFVVIFSHRDDPKQPGIKIVLSSDGGQTYNLKKSVCVWDAYGKEALGVARTNTYPSSHDSIAYGAPRITRLNDREAIAGWWCTQGSDTHCRWARVKVE